MTTRVITRQQFSPDTTIDGNRIEISLQDVMSRFNSPEFRDIDMWKENTIHYGFTPQTMPHTVDYYRHQEVQGSPFAFCRQSIMPPSVPGWEGPENDFRFKGTGLIDPITGRPLFATNDVIPEDLAYFWTATQFFSKPTIIQDWTVFAVFDDLSDRIIDSTRSWYANAFYSQEGPYGKTWYDNFMCYIVIDNNQDVGDAFIRNNEVHQWGTKAQGLLMNHPKVIIPNVYSDEELIYNPTAATATVQKINANAIRFHNINIPVPANSRIRFVLGLPAIVKEDDPNIRMGDAVAPYSYVPTSENNWGEVIGTYQNNIWNMSIHVFEPLERITNV
jgi:hypothetical protein